MANVPLGENMDVTFSNMLEGTRQYFMGLPKPASEGGGWVVDEAAPAPGPPLPAAPRPPSEPLEPEPHIIHKATVMREAAEKRRERPEPDDDDEAAAPSPPAAAPPSAPAPPAARPPDRFAPARPPDPYSSSRPPEPYTRYVDEAARAQQSVRPSGPPTYTRLSGSLPPPARMRSPVPPARYGAAPQPNDRVPPLHPPAPVAPYPRHVSPHREPSPYARTQHYERHPPVPQRKYDPQQAYPGYRPAPLAPTPTAGQRLDVHHAAQYKHAAVDAMGAHYPARPVERPPAQYPLPPAEARRPDYASVARSSAQYAPAPASQYPASGSQYAPPAGAQYTTPSTSSAQPRAPQRPPAAPKSSYEYPTTNHVQTSPARSTVKSGYPSQQARMTVSVTTLVNQMNQTKQKRESPLDLSVKTVKNSADSSTTPDDVVESATVEKPLQARPTSSGSRHTAQAPGFVESHKVDFAPDFTQYRQGHERAVSHGYPPVAPPAPHPVRYNGGYEAARAPTEPYPVESRHHSHVYHDRSKYGVPVARAEYVPRIDLTRPAAEERRPEPRVRDDRHFIIEERKRPSGPIVSNIPEKIVMYETWTADSRIDRMTHSAAREQKELMSQPVYSYSSYKQFEAYQNAQKRMASSNAYREQHSHVTHRYPYPPDPSPRDRPDYHAHSHDRTPSAPSRHVIQKIPSHRDIHPHPHQLDPHSGLPADKRILSILRDSLETKQSCGEPARPPRQIPDLIVIDDVDDPVIEITDLTKENEVETSKADKPVAPQLGHHIQMPKAVDSIPSDYHRLDNSDSKSSPENDVASRIRTKAELKVMPPSDSTIRTELKLDEPIKQIPKSQKQHLFNQIREDQRLESVIKMEKYPETTPPLVKSEPMNIDEIEKDAIESAKMGNENLDSEITEPLKTPEPDDLDWASACDSFMEQLKSGAHKKKTQRKRTDTIDLDVENKNSSVLKVEPTDSTPEKPFDQPGILDPPIVIKQEPLDEDDIKQPEEHATPSVLEPKVVDNQVSKSMAIEETPIKEKVDETPTKEMVEKKKESTPKTTEDKVKDKDEKIKIGPEKSNKKDSVKRKKCLTETPDKERIKIKKSLHEEKMKLVNKVKKRLSLQDEKESDIIRTKISTSPQVEKESKRGRNKKTSLSQEVSDTDKEKLKTKKSTSEIPEKDKKLTSKVEKNKTPKKNGKLNEKFATLSDKTTKDNTPTKVKTRSDKKDILPPSTVTIKKEVEEEPQKPLEVVIKEEPESTDDDEPLIKSKIMKEKEMRYQLMKDLSEKSAYVKLECFDVDLNKNTRISIDSLTKDKDTKGKITKQAFKGKDKIENNKIETQNDDTSTSSDDDELTVATRLRVRKNTKTEDSKTIPIIHKTPVKASLKKHDYSTASASSTPVRKPGFGDGSDFHPGWEEELFRYKRSLRMPQKLIAIPRGSSGGPHARGSRATFNRGSTSLPDLDPAPLSPAPSSAPSAATDADLYARRQDKLTLDSDLESNSSYCANNRLHYDSEASTSTVFSSSVRKKTSSIVDVLIQKCGKRDESRRKMKDKDKDEKTPKVIPKNPSELLPTPSLGLVKNGNKGGLNVKKEKLMEDIFYLGAFRKETVTAFRTAFIQNTDGLIGATEEFAPVVLKSRTRTESRVMKQRATIKEVFGDERPASAPPTSGRDNEEEEEQQETEDEPIVQIKKEKEPEQKPKLKPKKILKDKFRRSSSIRDGLRSTKSLKRNDAKGRLMRLKKRNSLMKSLASKRMKDLSNKIKKEKPDDTDENKPKEEGSSPGTVEGTKRRLKRLFGRRKFSSGFDYIRKKKKIIRREDTPNNKIRRPAVKPSPESESDIQKEIKGWFINKSVGETHLHRAARLGFTDCVAYCLEKMEADPSAKDNAGFTPLHVAAAKGHVRIARLLLQYGANVSAAANGGIRPLHEACENCHVEVIRLLLSYGADPLLGTYAGQTPEELTDGPAARLLRLHIADVQGYAIEPWRFPPPTEIINREELGNDPLSSPPPGSPPPSPDATIEMQCTEAPLPPFYSLRPAPGQSADGLWCLLTDITSLLQIKSKESLLKQIHCGSGSPKELLREIRTQEFLERAQCSQLLCAGEKVNVRASKVALVRVTDKLRQLLKIETVLIS